MIFGKRVRLRGVEKKDIEQFVVWLNDPDVRNNLLIYLIEHWKDQNCI